MPSQKLRKITLPEGVIYHGDVLEVLRSLPEHSVDLVISSPPYESARLYLENGQKSQATTLEGQDWVDWMVEVIEESLRVCKGLVAYVVGHGTGAHKWSATPALLLADLYRKDICLRRPLWYKRFGICGSGGHDWMRADLEFIVCATNGGPLPWSDNTACGHPPTWQPGGPMSNRTKDGNRVSGPRVTQKRVTGSQKEGAQSARKLVSRPLLEKSNPGDVIDCRTVGGGNMGSNIAHDNEAAFPTKLPWFFIKSFCPPNGTVLDPFGGSGTTLSEAVKSGRRFITSDVRLSQIKLMLRRHRQAIRQKGLLEI